MLRLATKCMIQQPRKYAIQNNKNVIIQRSYHFLHRQQGRATSVNKMQLNGTTRMVQRLSTFRQSTNGNNPFLPLVGITLLGAASLFDYNNNNNNNSKSNNNHVIQAAGNNTSKVYTRAEVAKHKTSAGK